MICTFFRIVVHVTFHEMIKGHGALQRANAPSPRGIRKAGMQTYVCYRGQSWVNVTSIALFDKKFSAVTNLTVAYLFRYCRLVQDDVI